MSYIVYIILLIHLCFNAVFTVKIKNINPTYIIKMNVLVYILITCYLFYNSIYAYDSISYRYYFETTYTNYTTDYAFYILTNFISNLTSNYNLYRMIIGIISLVPILLIIRRYTINNMYLFLLLNLIYPFLLNFITLKNTIASVLAFFAFYIWINLKNKNLATIFALIIIAISSLFHNTSVLYFFILITFLIIRKIKKDKILFLMMTSFFLISVYFIRSGFFDGILELLVGEDNTSYLYRLNEVGYGFIFVLLIQIMYLIILKYYINKKTNEEINNIDKEILSIHYSLFILLPIYSINTLVYFRIASTFMVYLFLIAANGNKSTEKISYILVALQFLAASFSLSIPAINSIFL